MVKDANTMWERMKDALLKAGSEICGWSRARPRHRETWWWNDTVDDAITKKRSKFKAWCQVKGTQEEETALREYMTSKKEAKKTVAQAQQREKTVRGKAGYERRAEVGVQDCEANGKGKAGCRWSELPEDRRWQCCCGTGGGRSTWSD